MNRSDMNFATKLMHWDIPQRDTSDWKLVPEELKTRDNYETFVYMKRMGFDAVIMFNDAFRKMQIDT